MSVYRLCSVLLLLCLSGHLSTFAGEPPSPPEPEATEPSVEEPAETQTTTTAVPNPDVTIEDQVQLGERLVYLAKWSGVPGGTISCRVWPAKRRYKGREVLLFEMRMETNDFMSAFYPINSTIRSFTDAKTGHSLLFKRKLRDGSYRANDQTFFDYTRKNELGTSSPAAITSMIREETTEVQAPRVIPGPLADPLSIAYYMRHLKAEKIGDTTDILLSDRDAISVVQFKVLAFEPVHLTGIGTFDCVVIEPATREHGGLNDGLLKTEGSTKIWVEKNTRIPLLGEVEIPVGRATAVLTNYENCNLDQYIVSKAPPEEKAESTTPDAEAVQVIQNTIQKFEDEEEDSK